ncbi:retrovirus-related pol polyprotein from transposon TNT 1-94 [Tanacetum coccineum]
MLAPDCSSETTIEGYMEIYKNVLQDIRDQLTAKAEAVQIILTKIDNDIYSTVDASPNACEMWKAIESSYFNYNQNGKGLTLVKQSQELKTVSYHKLYDILKQHRNEVNEIRAERLARTANPLALRVVNVARARDNAGTQVVQKSGIQCYNCKEYGHVSRECQKPKRAKDTAYHKEKMLLCKQEEAGVQLNAEQAYWKDHTNEHDNQELEAHYMYMEQIQDVTPDAADNFGPIFNVEPLQKVQNDDDNYNVFDNDQEHPEQPKSVNEPYPVEQDEHNIIIDSMDMSYDREQDDQDDTDDLAKERDLLASLIEKLKCKIDDCKNRNKFLESSNKALVDKLKVEIEDFKTKNKSLESSNNHFKEANNELSKTNQLMFKDLKKFQAELDRYHDVNYASKVEIDCAKDKRDLMSYKMESKKSFNEYTRKINDLNQMISDMKKELVAHQETISIMSQEKEAQTKFHKTRDDKELEKIIALENKIKVLDDIVYKTGQSVQTMNMLNRNCKTSFVKPEFLKKAQRANPRLYDIGCYNDNLALMLALKSEEMIRLTQESRSKLSDLIRPFDYNKLNNLYDLFVRIKQKSQENGQKRANTNTGTEEHAKSREKTTKSQTRVYTTLDEFTDIDEVSNLQCDYLETLEKCEHLEKELPKSRTMSESFEALQKHAINLELDLQQCKEKIKNDKSFKENQSNVFLKEREQYFKIQDLKAQLHDKGITISELKKLIEKMKGKSMKTKFAKSSVIRQPNTFKSQRKSVLGKPAIFIDSLEKKDFSKSKSVTKNNVSNDFSKPTTAQILPQNINSILKNINVIAPRIYIVHTEPNQTKTPHLPQDIRKTNTRVSFSTGVIPTTSVSRPQLKSNRMGDRVMPNNSQEKKHEVEDHRRNFKFSNNKTFVTACNDGLNAKTSNVNFICVTCGKCVLNENHDMCVLHYINDVNSRTRQPIDVPISTKKPKQTVNQSVSTSYKKTVATGSTIKKPRNIIRNIYEQVSVPLCPILHCLQILLQLVEIILFIVDSGCSKNMTGNLKLPTNFVEKFLGTVKFENDQIAPILGYGDLVQGTITIKRVYYVEGLNHNLFSVGQFCDADLEVAFRKSTCYICDLKGNDLLTGSHGTYLYSITLQHTSTPNLICLMAKATSSQAWLWHRRLSHLNLDTINFLLKNNIVTGLPNLKFVKDHLCSSCELGKAKRNSFHTKTTPSSKRMLQLLHMDLCGPMRVESINGKKYVLVIVDDYSRYTWTHFLRSKDETPAVLIDFLTLVQRGLHAQVRTVRTDKGTKFLNKTLHAYFAKEGIRPTLNELDLLRQ